MSRLTTLLTTLLSLTTLATSAPPPPAGGPPKPPPPPAPAKPTPIAKRTAAEVIAQLNLTPNPERGYFVETFRDTLNVTSPLPPNPRSASTAIYYLLEGAEGWSRWHRVDAVEVWHYYAGAPLSLALWKENGTEGVREQVLGPDVFAADGQRPQVVVSGWEWQRARSWGEWTLVGTTVAPGFEVSGSEIADDDWTPAV
ncbi:RmlC-like cupin domain-containing protein [Echria macrotheca]|uniref:RmlC-like cupin domain-containing protein n=1 Tax=Echria macrotheca TaxID=438768 RepID=A0AAJ0B798_9PEZI|nr:RmlC-like cupin domain-containing protein [Echria macrotheca]